MQDAPSAINLVDEGRAKEAEVTEGHTHFLGHPMCREDAGGVLTLDIKYKNPTTALSQEINTVISFQRYCMFCYLVRK